MAHLLSALVQVGSHRLALLQEVLHVEVEIGGFGVGLPADPRCRLEVYVECLDAAADLAQAQPAFLGLPALGGTDRRRPLAELRHVLDAVDDPGLLPLQ